MPDAHSAGTDLQRRSGPKEFSRRILHFGLHDNATDFAPREDTYPKQAASICITKTRFQSIHSSRCLEYDLAADCVNPNKEATQPD